jgi:hypothetical protein
VGSRVRITAASCLVACGLLIGGTGAALAFADPSQVSGDPGDSDGNQANDTGEPSKHDPANAGPEGGAGPQVGDGRGGPTPGGENSNENGPGPGAHKPGEFKPGEFKPGEHNPEDYHPGEHHPRDPDGEDPEGEGGPGTDPGGTPSSGNSSPTTKSPPSSTPPETCPESRGEGCGCGGSNDSKDSNGEGGCGPDIPERPPWLPPWWPWPPPVGQPAPGPGGGAGGGGGAIEAPWGRPGGGVPGMQLPDELMPPAQEPAEPGVLSSVPGVGVAAAVPPMVPITLPVIIAPSFGVGGGGAPAAPAPRLPAAPRRVAAEPPAGKPLPATAGGTVEVSNVSYRVGYGEYLRSAGISQVAALAVPGVTGILVLTGAGGLVGYRQAKAGLAVRSGSTARFVK